MAKRTVTLTDKDIESLKLLFSFLAIDISKKEMKEIQKTDKLPARLQALRTILTQIEPQFVNKFLGVFKNLDEDD